MTINRKHPRRNAFPLFSPRLRTLPALVAALLCGLSLPSALAELGLPEIPRKKKKKDKNEQVIPPQAIPTEVQITPGGEVTIPLRVYGWRGRNLRYLLRSEPKQGAFALVPGEKGVWGLVYRHNGTIPPEAGSVDRFFYAAQDGIGTSAPAEIKVNIVDFEPKFEFADAAEFGEVHTGEAPQQTFTIANRGGGMLVGRLFADAPWTVSPEEYVLKRGEEKTITVTFSPTSEQEYKGRLTVSGDREAIMQLSGLARDPFRLDPSSLTLLVGEDQLSRSGLAKIENRTETAQTLTLTADPRLSLPEEITLPAGESVELPLQLSAEDLLEFKGAITFSNGTIERSLRVDAHPIGVRLFAEALAFGELEASETDQAEKTLKVANRGGTGANITVTAPPGITVEPLRFDLAAGEEAELTVSFTPRGATELRELRETLRLQSAGAILEVALSADILPAGSPAPRRERQMSEHPLSQPDPSAGTDSLSALPTGDPTVPSVQTVTLRYPKNDTVAISWNPVEGKGDFNYRLEIQRIFSNFDGRPRIIWEPLSKISITKEGGQYKATLPDVPRGVRGQIRIVTIASDGRLSLPSAAYSFGQPPPRPFFTPRLLALLGFSIIGAGALFLRLRRPAETLPEHPAGM